MFGFKILKIFLGPPGSGKTTSAQMLGRNHDYKVYEADCYIAFKNPLVDPNDKHPFFSMAKKRPMKVHIFGTKTIKKQIIPALTQWARKLKKSPGKKIVKSNKSKYFYMN